MATDGYGRRRALGDEHMSAASERELKTRVSDFEGAVSAIGKILSDTSIAPGRRIDQAFGILRMYGWAPKAEEENATK